MGLDSRFLVSGWVRGNSPARLFRLRLGRTPPWPAIAPYGVPFGLGDGCELPAGGELHPLKPLLPF
jgi:hypothetical protein